MTNLYTYEEVLDIMKYDFCLHNQPHDWQYIETTTEYDTSESWTDDNYAELPENRRPTIDVKIYRCSKCKKMKEVSQPRIIYY